MFISNLNFSAKEQNYANFIIRRCWRDVFVGSEQQTAKYLSEIHFRFFATFYYQHF